MTFQAAGIQAETLPELFSTICAKYPTSAVWQLNSGDVGQLHCFTATGQWLGSLPVSVSPVLDPDALTPAALLSDFSWGASAVIALYMLGWAVGLGKALIRKV